MSPGRSPCPARADEGSHRALEALLAALALAGLSAPGCAPPPTPRCASDIDCGSSTSCDHGACRAAASRDQQDLRPARLVLYPLQDVAVVSSRPSASENHGDADLLAVGNDGRGSIYRTYLDFDVTELRGVEIAGAELRLVNNPRWSQGETVLEIVALPAASSWSEHSLSWRQQPGGAGGPRAETAIRPGHNRDTTFDVMDLVTAWAANAEPNRGLLLRARREDAPGRAVWYSSESTQLATRPALEIEVR